MTTITDVAVAVFITADGRFLLSSRPHGKAYAGYWEFPGGKLEPGESVRDALVRELEEELNVVIDECTPWFSFKMTYPHATVRLRTWRVTAWHGADQRGMHGMEGQSFCWQRLNDIAVSPVLPGCLPIFRALSLPTTYTITNASEQGAESYLQHLRASWGNHAANGTPDGAFVSSDSAHKHLIQIREKNMPEAALRQFATDVTAIARQHNALVLVNSDVELALAVGADGVQLTGNQLARLTARPPLAWVGASAHSRDDVLRAAELKCDFVVVGSVKPTDSHPGQAPLGWPAFAEMVRDSPIPAFAIGGLLPSDFNQAAAHGAHGIAMQRAAL